ncbi:hypothetical protein BCR32DRAFT_282300 [Anaeromyces robustus]|uniref:Uncharacterized protein n=1 Tax=Anaeromyces robustus TaxID=1754192 RepID=A0A1Y1WXW3_9FUNG|nr:hypothetical protein BCR32DRAFT_282300 [Anaeromyces robustus]|eukprot:ORX78419.1 hypothetical protein BCR32DRAFT_282300 [Anaeromyces robustus]
MISYYNYNKQNENDTAIIMKTVHCTNINRVDNNYNNDNNILIYVTKNLEILKFNN